MSTSSQKRKAGRAKVSRPPISPDRETAEAAHAEITEASKLAMPSAKPKIEVGKTYEGTDGKTYEVISANDAGFVVKREKKKMPMPRAMFEVLVGVKTEDEYKEEKEARRIERKKAAETADPKKPRISGMSVIRNTLANNLEATVEEISAACKAAGVPKKDSTIVTIMSDFKQTYKALLEADRIVID
jgi:hypothetical protein